MDKLDLVIIIINFLLNNIILKKGKTYTMFGSDLDHLINSYVTDKQAQENPKMNY